MEESISKGKLQNSRILSAYYISTRTDGKNIRSHIMATFVKSFDGIDKLLDNQIGMAKKKNLKVSVCHITRDVLSSSSY